MSDVKLLVLALSMPGSTTGTHTEPSTSFLLAACTEIAGSSECGETLNFRFAFFLVISFTKNFGVLLPSDRSFAFLADESITFAMSGWLTNIVYPLACHSSMFLVKLFRLANLHQNGH